MARSSRRAWSTAGLFGTLLALSLFWLSARADDETPQLRIVSVGQSVTALIVDGHESVLIANATNENDARSALGALRRPWDGQPSVAVAQASEAAASGVQESLERATPAQLIVAGAPGDSEAWAAIERYCRDHAIDINYLDDVAILDLAHLTVSVVPQKSPAGPSWVAISRGDVRIAVALSGLPVDARLHVAVSSDKTDSAPQADLLVTSETQAAGRTDTTLLLERGRRVVLLIDEDRVRVRGGRVVVAGAD